MGFEGHADLTAPDATCGACSCDAPSGSCELPATVTANAASCALNSATTPHTTFDPVTGWSGSCDDSDSIASGKLCSGVQCVQSVTIAPLAVNESGCAPVTQPVPKGSPSTWATFARACTGTPRGACASPAEMCSPVAPPGFRACVFTRGDLDCPSFSPYRDKHVFYEGLDDTRGCTPCTCGAPAGSTCSSLLSIYTDAACSALLDAITITSSTPQCHDLPPGSALGSKSAGPATYTPGACVPSGGEPVGAATPSQPVTFCCLP